MTNGKQGGPGLRCTERVHAPFALDLESARFTRRVFLGASAAVVGAAALGACSPEDDEPAVAADSSSAVARIKHVVILMQENRSFDHYFGTLRGVCGFDDRTAMTLRNGASVFRQPSAGGSVLPFHMDTKTSSAHCFGNLANNWHCHHEVWNGGNNDSWAWIKSPLTMGYFTRADLPFHYALADAFTVCDNYRCSIMGATGPNRTYLWRGTFDPNGRSEGPIINGGHESGLSWTTYAERLQAAGVSWKVYQVASDNYGDNGLAYFTRFEKAKPGDPLYDRGMASVPSIVGETAIDIAMALRSDALNGTLPMVSWIVGPASASEHPEHSPAAGADFIRRVFAALTADPAVWASTALLVNYDENDDFFDHAVPVTPPPGTPDEFVDGVPIGLGARVPLLVISPWSRGGYVCSELFDHTSVIRFLERLTGVVEPNLSAWRRQMCGDLMSAFDFTTHAVDVPVLPDTGAHPIACADLPSPRPPDVPRMPIQEPGQRPQRPLPYQPNATCIVDATAGTIGVRMTNGGSRSVHYSIYAHHQDAAGPWQHDVKAGGSVQAELQVPDGNGRRFDLSTYGPNGFLRRVSGSLDSVSVNVEVIPSYDLGSRGNGRFVLTMINGGTVPVKITIASNAHRTDGPWVHEVAPGAARKMSWDIEQESDRWYDFVATLDVDPTFVRRFAGRLEVGGAERAGTMF